MSNETTEKTQLPQQPQQGQVVINAQINIPISYTNGTLVSMSAADLQITLATNGRPTNILTMSFTTAKSLQAGLTKAISDYERKTNTVVLDINQTGELIKKP